MSEDQFSFQAEMYGPATRRNNPVHSLNPLMFQHVSTETSQRSCLYFFLVLNYWQFWWEIDENKIITKHLRRKLNQIKIHY